MDNEQPVLRDPTIVPTDEVIAAGLGTANRVYTKFIEELKKYDISLMEWRYYNDGKAWLSKGEYKWTTSRGTNKVKSIFWISIWSGFFKVSFLFNERARDELLGLSISEETKKMIKNIKPNGNKIKFLSVVFNVDNTNQFYDIFELSKFRKENT